MQPTLNVNPELKVKELGVEVRVTNLEKRNLSSKKDAGPSGRVIARHNVLIIRIWLWGNELVRKHGRQVDEGARTYTSCTFPETWPLEQKHFGHKGQNKLGTMHSIADTGTGSCNAEHFHCLDSGLR
jgi:hypothetical protein